jgi:predicted acylesterase/phospholipase RssA
MPIQHLVLSGGGPLLIQHLGVLQQLEKENIINTKELKSIYGTSAGGIVALLLCLQFDSWDIIINYIIGRPWHELYCIDTEKICNSYSKCGLFDIDVLTKTFQPLFDVKKISIHITMEELFAICAIELHVFALEVNSFTIEDISYITHPQLEVLQAIHMTCAIPILFTPQYYQDKMYLDGGILCNYPNQYCITKYQEHIDDIFGIRIVLTDKKRPTSSIQPNIISFIMHFIGAVIFYLSSLYKVNNNQQLIHEIIIYQEECITLHSIAHAVSNAQFRRSMFEKGIDIAKEYVLKN